MFTPAAVALAPLSSGSKSAQPGETGTSVLAFVSALPLKYALKPGENILLLHFKSALLEAQALESQFGRVRAGSCNLGDPNRVYVRKAQYGWRWDWGKYCIIRMQDEY